MNFKFKVGDEVHHSGWKVNCFVHRRIFTEDEDDSYVSYDLFVVGNELRVIGNATEFWLEEGHRIE